MLGLPVQAGPNDGSASALGFRESKNSKSSKNSKNSEHSLKARSDRNPSAPGTPASMGRRPERIPEYKGSQMAEIPAKPENPDDFNPETFEEPERGVEVYEAGQHAIARPGDVRFTAHLKPVYLNIVHGVGALSEAGYPKGALVLDKEVEIYSPPRPAKPGEAQAKDEPAVVTILSVQEFWKEEVKYGSGMIPRTWATKAEALAAGMTTEYPPWNSGLPMPNVRPALSLKMLVREPEGVTDRGHFLLNIGNEWWAPCTMIADKTAYGEVVDPITRATYTHGSTGIHSATWALSTRSKLIKSTSNFTFVPVLRIIGTKTPAEIQNLLDVVEGRRT